MTCELGGGGRGVDKRSHNYSDMSFLLALIFIFSIFLNSDCHLTFHFSLCVSEGSVESYFMM